MLNISLMFGRDAGNPLNSFFAVAKKGFEPGLAVHSAEYTSLRPSIPNNSHSSANFHPSFVGLPAFTKATDEQAGNLTDFIIYVGMQGVEP